MDPNAKPVDDKQNAAAEIRGGDRPADYIPTAPQLYDDNPLYGDDPEDEDDGE